MIVTFENNGYHQTFVNFCIKKYLDKVFIKKEVVLKATKKELMCALPFVSTATENSFN